MAQRGDYLIPVAGTITAGNSVTIPEGFTNLFVDNSIDSSGIVTITYYKNDVEQTSFTLEPGKNRSYWANNRMFDKFVITCAMGTTAYYDYLT